jgi:hypothetical protein
MAANLIRLLTATDLIKSGIATCSYTYSIDLGYEETFDARLSICSIHFKAQAMICPALDDGQIKGQSKPRPLWGIQRIIYPQL